MVTKRICRLCNGEFPLCKFASAGTKNGKQYLRRLCKKCYQETKKPQRGRMRLWWIEIKKQYCCARCGINDFRILSFHHLGGKKFNLSDAVQHCYSKQRIYAELKKCICLCFNCHGIETWEQRNGRVQTPTIEASSR